MEENRLYTMQRRNEILRLIKEQGSVSVNDLAAHFRVSGTTIRLDLSSLEEAGSLKRTHGGAMPCESLEREPLMRERKNNSEKERIAKKALSYIQEHDTILIDTGTTMLSLAAALCSSQLSRLTVYSNDLDVLRTLEEKENFDLHLLGGTIRNGFHYTFGAQVVQALNRYHFPKLFLATSAISLQHGLTTANSDLASVKAAMIEASDEVLLLTDSSKMHHVAFQRFAGLEQVDWLITDTGMDRQAAAALRGKVRGEVICA